MSYRLVTNFEILSFRQASAVPLHDNAPMALNHLTI
jgi:hypothetical protein